MSADFILTLTESDGSVRERRLAPGSYVIGREADCDIVVSSGDVSRHHARLTLHETDLLIEDLGSSTGTQVQNLPVSAKPQRWPYPQTLSVGSVRLAVCELDGAGGISLTALGADPRASVPFVFGHEIARGGMGSIIEADDKKLGRKIAVKVMLLEVEADDAQKQRFVQEAAVLGKLAHPNIVPVYDLGLDSQGQLYYTMKLVKGRTLQAILNDLRKEAPEVLRHYKLAHLLTIFRKVCDAMAFAHSKGIIHRDLKPENIMVGEFGEVLVMDWGLAKILGSEADAPARNAATSSSGEASATQNFGSTLEGSVMGTPQYMSPEQAEGRIADMDARSDIFSLGGILYCILTLRPPVEGTTLDEVLEKVISGSVTPPSVFGASTSKAKPGAKREVLEARKIKPLPHCPGGRVPAALSAVTMKALRVQREQRYPNTAALSADIDAYQTGFATSAEQAGAWKQLILLVKRHKAASIAAATIIVLTAGFMAKIISSERRARQTLAELKGTAPTFQAQALALIEATPIAVGAPEKALEHIGHAIALAPESADYLVTRGRILQTLQRLDEARTAFAGALALAPENSLAKANLPVCEAVLHERLGDGAFGPSTLAKLAASLSAQGRNAEALYVTRTLAKIGAAQLAIWNAIIRKAGLSQNLHLDKDGSLSLHANGETSLDQISFLRGIPLNGLFISGSRVSDLSPLAGMPLREFDIGESRVVDITPLAGMPLQRITLPGSVTDLSPLRGAPLEAFSIDPFADGSGPSDFSVLRDMPLREVIVGGSNFADLRLLEGKPLTFLNIGATKVSDLSPLRGMPLESLYMPNLKRANLRDLAFLEGNKTLHKLYAPGNHQLIDLSALRGLPVESLFLDETGITDLRPLAGSNVSEITLNSTPFTAIEQLAAMRQLTTVLLEGTPGADLAPLAGSTLQKITLRNCSHIRSVAPLAKLSTLRVLLLPVQARDLDALRAHSSLQWLGYGGNVPNLSDAGKQPENLRDFWQMHDLETRLRAAEPDGRLRPSKFPQMRARFPRARSLGGKWYSFIPGKFTWPEAKQLAKDLGGYLATITSQADYDLTRELANIGQGQVCWLGGQIDKPGGAWHWVNGEPWEYTHWAKWKDGKSEPNYDDPKSGPKTSLAFAYFGANFATPPDLCNLVPDHEAAAGLLVEWDR